MPKTRRQRLLEIADQALNDLDRAFENLNHLADAYRVLHPDYTQAVEVMIEALAQVHDFVKVFRTERM